MGRENKIQPIAWIGRKQAKVDSTAVSMFVNSTNKATNIETAALTRPRLTADPNICG